MLTLIPTLIILSVPPYRVCACVRASCRTDPRKLVVVQPCLRRYVRSQLWPLLSCVLRTKSEHILAETGNLGFGLCYLDYAI